MSREGLPPLKPVSLKAQCTAHLERLIISGELPIGASLPPEREFAKELGVSRPVLHEAIVDLAAKGFLVIAPRRGIRVKDFYREGTLATFEAIIQDSDGAFPSGIIGDITDFRALIELEAARLAASRGGGERIVELRAVVAEEGTLSPLPAGLEGRVALDMRFHMLIVEASGNRILPLVMHSLAPVYASLVRKFYEAGPEPSVVLDWHRRLVEAIVARDREAAARLAEEMLRHGALMIGASS